MRFHFLSIQIRELIKKIARQGTTILLASHLLDEVEKVCSHVVILRKGENLYSGKVDGMLASHGFFELQAEDLPALKAFLDSREAFSHVEQEDGILTAYLKTPMESAALNALCFENGIRLSHLVKRKESLEQQFLAITNQKTPA